MFGTINIKFVYLCYVYGTRNYHLKTRNQFEKFSSLNHLHLVIKEE